MGGGEGMGDLFVILCFLGLLYEAIQDERAKLCFFSIVHIVCYILPCKMYM